PDGGRGILWLWRLKSGYSWGSGFVNHRNRSAVCGRRSGVRTPSPDARACMSDCNAAVKTSKISGIYRKISGGGLTRRGLRRKRLRAHFPPCSELCEKLSNLRRHHKLAVRLIPVVAEVFLMIVLRQEEFGRRHHLRHDRIWKRLFAGQF